MLLISNHNSFRVLFDKLLPCILFENHIYILASKNGQPREPALYQLYRQTFVPYITRLVLLLQHGQTDRQTDRHSSRKHYQPNHLNVIILSRGEQVKQLKRVENNEENQKTRSRISNETVFWKWQISHFLSQCVTYEQNSEKTLALVRKTVNGRDLNPRPRLHPRCRPNVHVACDMT